METFSITFERVLTWRDRKHNLPFLVTVPAGTTRIDLRFSFAPHTVEEINNLLTLTVLSPAGWRGSGHRHGDLHEIVIAEDHASPGFVPGPIPPGQWTVIVDTHMVMPGPDCHIRLEAHGSDEPAHKAAPVFQPGSTASRGPGWYRGDLHAHTVHSDASWEVGDLVAFARERGLDFTTLSDHNTVAGLAEMDAARSDNLLTLGGMELTTFYGHALALGLRDWVDWRLRQGERGMPEIEREVSAAGGTFIIAHPAEIGDPYCTGCNWRYDDMMPGTARVVEVWNQEWDNPESENEHSLKLAYEWLNAGHRLALTAGTDNHGRSDVERRYGFDVVYAEELTEEAVLRAVRQGHLYLSSGPGLMLDVRAGGQQLGMGDSIRAAGGEPVQIHSAWENSPEGALLSLVVDGQEKERRPAVGGGWCDWDLRGGEAGWFHITLRAPDGVMLALTNPVYLDGRA